MPCRLHDRLDRCMTAYAEHGLMYEDARQHHRAAYYYKQAIMTGTQNPGAAVNESMDSVFIGIAEAYDGAWQDTGNGLLFASLVSSGAALSACWLRLELNTDIVVTADWATSWMSCVSCQDLVLLVLLMQAAPRLHHSSYVLNVSDIHVTTFSRYGEITASALPAAH